MEEITGEVLAELLSTSPQEKEELQATLQNATGDERLDVLKEATRNLRSGFKKQGIDEATRKINSRWEKALNVEGFDSNTQGVDRVSEFLEFVQSSQQQGAKKVELTKEKALDNPVVKELISQRANAAAKEWEEKYKTLSSQYEQEKQHRIDGKVREEILKVAKSAKINLGESEEMVRARTETLFLAAKAKSGGFAVDGDKIIPLNKDGEPLRDDTYFNEISFQEFVTKHVNNNGALFPVSTVDNSKNNPQPNQGATQRGGNNLRFSNQEDFMNQWREAKSKEERKDLHKAWSEQQQAEKVK